jgi:hypothetical protein
MALWEGLSARELGFALLYKRIKAFLAACGAGQQLGVQGIHCLGAIQNKDLNPLFWPLDEQVVWHKRSDVALFLSGEYLSRLKQDLP